MPNTSIPILRFTASKLTRTSMTPTARTAVSSGLQNIPSTRRYNPFLLSSIGSNHRSPLFHAISGTGPSFRRCCQNCQKFCRIPHSGLAGQRFLTMPKTYYVPIPSLPASWWARVRKPFSNCCAITGSTRLHCLISKELSAKKVLPESGGLWT